MGTTFRPGVKVHLLTTLKFASAEFVSPALVLNRLFSRPTDHERTCRLGYKIRVFSSTLYGVEDDLQTFCDSDADQGGLRYAGISDRTEDSESALHQESVEIGLCHREYCT